jgi:Rrf2 family protein
VDSFKGVLRKSRGSSPAEQRLWRERIYDQTREVMSTGEVITPAKIWPLGVVEYPERDRMRTISKRTQYGLKAVLALGQRYREGPVLISTLAKEESIPLKFLEVILLDLKTHGLLESKVGRKGGYRLSRPPAAVTMGTIVRILEGPLAPLPCASESAYKPCRDCTDVETCGTRIIMRQVRDAISGVLDSTTLADLLRLVETRRGEKSDPQALMYYI